jgi:hypothetical protein
MNRSYSLTHIVCTVLCYSPLLSSIHLYDYNYDKSDRSKINISLHLDLFVVISIHVVFVLVCGCVISRAYIVPVESSTFFPLGTSNAHTPRNYIPTYVTCVCSVNSCPSFTPLQRIFYDKIAHHLDEMTV